MGLNGMPRAVNDETSRRVGEILAIGDAAALQTILPAAR